MDIQQIWDLFNQNDFMIALNCWISRKCEHGENLEIRSEEERICYINFVVAAEVNNGGFSQFLFNSSGNVANEVIGALKAIGAEATARICQRALQAFGERIPIERMIREERLLEKETDAVTQIFEVCESAFYECPDDLEALQYAYMLNNKKAFL